MGILMTQPAPAQQRTVGLQRIDHGAVGVAVLALGRVDRLAGEQRRLVGKAAVAIHGHGHGQAVLETQLVVVEPMAGRYMHEARALFGAHEIGRDQRHIEIVAPSAQRMGADRTGQIRAL